MKKVHVGIGLFAACASSLAAANMANFVDTAKFELMMKSCRTAIKTKSGAQDLLDSLNESISDNWMSKEDASTQLYVCLAYEAGLDERANQ